MSRELPQLLLGIAALGYRWPITEHALSSLVAHAKEHGVKAVLSWIEDDPGLLVIPSWQFWSVSLASGIRDRPQVHCGEQQTIARPSDHDPRSNTTN